MDINEFSRDPSKIENGVWVGELSGLDPKVEFLVRGLSSEKYANRQMRLVRQAPPKDRESDRSLKASAYMRIQAELLPEYILLDWKGITKDGKPLPYSKELAKEMLRDRKFKVLMDAILEAASRVDDMRGEEKEVVAKN